MFLFDMIFFFSSRRRHTRLQGDWSSDVCSSDLGFLFLAVGNVEYAILRVHQRRKLRHDEVRHGRQVAFAQIGRASCRERVEISVGGGSLVNTSHLVYNEEEDRSLDN